MVKILLPQLKKPYETWASDDITIKSLADWIKMRQKLYILNDTQLFSQCRIVLIVCWRTVSRVPDEDEETIYLDFDQK